MYFFTNSFMHEIIYNASIGTSSDVHNHLGRKEPIDKQAEKQ